MTAPHKPSCAHLTNVTVADGPHQIVHDGQTYLAGDTITDVPADVAQYWLDNGWAVEAARAAEPAKTPPPPTRRK